MLTQRIEAIRQNYVNTKPQISCERAKIWTDSHRETEGQPVAIRRARAFYDCCDRLGVHIFAGEAGGGGPSGEFRKCGILTPEFSWMWVDREMDTFDTRPQDPYRMTDDQRAFVRREIFPYWKGKSLEEAFLARLPEDTYRIGVDTGVLDNDSKWRQAVGGDHPRTTRMYCSRRGSAGFCGRRRTIWRLWTPPIQRTCPSGSFTPPSAGPPGGLSATPIGMPRRRRPWRTRRRTLSEPRSCAGSPATAGGSRSIPRRVFTRPFSSCGLSRWGAFCQKIPCR